MECEGVPDEQVEVDGEGVRVTLVLSVRDWLGLAEREGEDEGAMEVDEEAEKLGVAEFLVVFVGKGEGLR